MGDGAKTHSPLHMKIAMLGVKSVPAIGGIAHYVEELGARLALRGHEVTVYCRAHYLDQPSGPYRGMARVVTRGIRGRHFDALTHTATATLHAMRSGAQIAHIHGIGPGCAAPLFRAKPRVRVIATVHGPEWRASKWGALAGTTIGLGARLADSSLDAVTAVSEAVQVEYQALTGRCPRYIPTGVSIPELVGARDILEMGLSAGGYIFCAARLVPEKGIHYLTEAFRDLDTDKQLVIAGDAPHDGPYVRRLREQVGSNVRFVGYVTGRLLSELYSNALFYVQPSQIEGLSISVLESLSYGRCVLASDIPTNIEALAGCGCTFRSGDVNDLRAKIRLLLDNPAQCEAEFTRTRTYLARERSWDTTTDQFEELYEAVLSSRDLQR